MKYQPTDSTALEGLSYDPLSRTLEIKFQNGRSYRYYLVPEAVYRTFLKANSFGEFFNTYIRDHYLYSEMPAQVQH